MVDAVNIARYLLKLAASEQEPEYLSHLRLQKLLYYVQGWTLVSKDRVAFDSPIEAWAHGPVVAAVYPVFADYGDKPIAFHEARDDGLDNEMKAIVDSIWEGYKSYSATQLRKMTHSEAPWMDARGDLPPDARSNAVIEIKAIQAFFTSVYDQNAAPGFDRKSLSRADASFEAGEFVSFDELKRRMKQAG